MKSQYQIKELFDIEKGSLQSSKCVEGEYDFITASSEWKTNKTYTHDCEALVFAMGAAGSLGRTHYVNGKFIASDLCFILTPKTDYLEKIDLKFYYYYFNSNRQTIVRLLATGTTKLAINQTKFSNYQIPYFDLTTQNKLKLIYDKVSVLNAELVKKINKQELYISKLRQSILQQAVEGKLCLQDPNDEPASELLKRIKAEKEQLVKDGKIKKEKPLPPIKDNEKPFALPQGWEWCRFGKVINISSNLVSPNQFLSVLHIAPDNIEKANGKLKFCRIVSEDNVISNNHYFKSGQIIYSKIRPKLRKVVIAPFDGLCSADMYPIDSFIATRFTFWYMLTDVFTEQVTRSDNRVKMPKTNQNDLSRVLVPVPPMQEQQRIVQKVDRLMSYCDELEKQITKSKDIAEKLMQSILAKAFNDQEEKQPTVIVSISPKVEPIPVKLAARGSISTETMQHIEQTINEMCGES